MKRCYIEELLNYLHERGLDPRLPETLGSLELPDSLQSLILGRIDQLTEDQRTALKVASVIGRLFDIGTLSGVYPPFAAHRELQHDLDLLTELDLTLPDVPEPEMTYLFKHALTQEVSYETLAYATRAMLHGQIGQFLEARYEDMIEQRLDLLAFHFDHSENTAKRIEYLRRAGVAAQAAAANVSAISYSERVLPVIEDADRLAVLLELAEVFDVTGQWDRAATANHEALGLAVQHGLLRHEARARVGLGVLDRKRGEYAAAQDWLSQARASYERAADPAGMSLALAHDGEVHRLQGRYDEARSKYDESLRLPAGRAIMPGWWRNTGSSSSPACRSTSMSRPSSAIAIRCWSRAVWRCSSRNRARPPIRWRRCAIARRPGRPSRWW